jgi:hypothetical protein
VSKTQEGFAIIEHTRTTKVIDVGLAHISVRALIDGPDIRWIELNWVDNVGNFVKSRLQHKTYLPKDPDYLQELSKALAELVKEIDEHRKELNFEGEEYDRPMP